MTGKLISSACPSVWKTNHKLSEEPSTTQKAKKMLLFAAASNNKHNGEVDIGFPASLSSRVICINAHGHGDRRCDFSPVDKPGRPNFAFLGEGIRAMGKDGNNVLRQGTSCSTPVASGVASIVLDYSV